MNLCMCLSKPSKPLDHLLWQWVPQANCTVYEEVPPLVHTKFSPISFIGWPLSLVLWKREIFFIFSYSMSLWAQSEACLLRGKTLYSLIHVNRIATAIMVPFNCPSSKLKSLKTLQAFFIRELLQSSVHFGCPLLHLFPHDNILLFQLAKPEIIIAMRLIIIVTHK